MTWRFFQAIMALVAGLVLVVIGPLAGASPVQAVSEQPSERLYNMPYTPAALKARALSQCNEEQILCLWNGYNYTGTMWKITKATLGGTSGYSFVGSGINNASKGWFNRVDQTITMYDNDHCLQPGWDRNLLQGQYAVSYNASTNDWENRISSASLYTGQGIYC